MLKVKTLKGAKVHAMPEKGEQVTLCGLYAQLGDMYIDPSRKVTCKRCLAKVTAA